MIFGPAVLKHKELVGEIDDRPAMGNHDHRRAAIPSLAQRRHQRSLARGIEEGVRFIEDQHDGRAVERAGEGDPLRLAQRQSGPHQAKAGIVCLGQVQDQFVHACFSRGRDHSFVDRACLIGSRSHRETADILLDRAFEQ